jgi:hypothetical protein
MTLDAAAVTRSLNRLSGQLSDVSSQQVILHNSVQVVSAAQDATRGELTDLRVKFDDYLRRDELARALQLAQTQIIAVRQELETKFGHYAEVRRLATGTLQAMDAGIVTNEMIREASEERMLTTPRYWLPPALLALAAWIRDDRPQAEHALSQALLRDNDKTALFFALVLRRQGRDGATARWVGQYVARQDPARLSREFTVIVDAVATGVLGVASKPALLGTMENWHALLRKEAPIADAQVERWRSLIDGMRPTLTGGFSVLPVVSPTWPQLLTVLQGAAAHGRADDFFRRLFDGPAGDSPDLRRRVDEILDNLVTRYDDEEAPHRRTEATLQAVIDHEGDKDKAQAVVQAEAAAHDTTLDLLTLLTNAAFYPEKVGASRGTQRLAVALTKDWIVAADAQLEAANVAALPREVVLNIEGWTGRINGGSAESQLADGLGRHIDAETDRQVQAVRFTGAPLVAAIGTGAGLLFALIAVAGGAPGFGVFLVLCALVCGAWSFSKYRGLPARRAAIRTAGAARKVQAVASLRGAVAETVDWRAAWETEIAKAEPLRRFVGALVRDAYVAATPDHRRGV